MKLRLRVVLFLRAITGTTTNRLLEEYASKWALDQLPQEIAGDTMVSEGYNQAIREVRKILQR